MATSMKLVLAVGDRIRLDNKSTTWLIRREACGGRYHVATCSLWGKVHYTILDHELGIRGPLNIIGQGMGIFTTSGRDAAIDETVRMLEADEGWEISHRNNVPMHVTNVHRRCAS